MPVDTKPDTKPDAKPKKSAYDQRLGRVLKTARERRGYSPMVVAEQLQVSDEHIRRIESGTASPDWDLACRLLTFFDLAARAPALILGQKTAALKREEPVAA